MKNYLRIYYLAVLVLFHAGFYLCYFFVKRNVLKFPKDIDRISLWPKYVQLSRHDLPITFVWIRKIVGLSGIGNSCLHTSVIFYWLAQSPVSLMFSVSRHEDFFQAHAWVQADARVFTTDSSFTGQPIYSLSKSAEV